jgi:hypothetical protein
MQSAVRVKRLSAWLGVDAYGEPLVLHTGFRILKTPPS